MRKGRACVPAIIRIISKHSLPPGDLRCPVYICRGRGTAQIEKRNIFCQNCSDLLPNKLRVLPGQLPEGGIQNQNAWLHDAGTQQGGKGEGSGCTPFGRTIKLVQWQINFSFKYDSSKTLNLSSSGSTVVEIQQPANMELVMPRFSDSVSVGETVPIFFQVMNMGRSSMFNVRCTVSGYGLVPSNTGYIGTMEAGTSKTTKVELYIIALNASAGNENGPQYGDTTGTVTLIYEDETGQEYSQEATFTTTVNRPVVQLPQNNTEEEQSQQRASSWWVSVSILGGGILAAVGAALFTRGKKRRSSNDL